MANKKITDYTATTTLAASDLVEVVTDVGGTPTSKKVAATNLLSGAATATPQLSRLGLGAAADGTYLLNLGGTLVHGTATGLGIGTTGPGAKLDIYDSSTPTVDSTILTIGKGISTGGIDGSIDFRFQWVPTSTYWTLARINATEAAGYGGGLSFYTKVADSNASGTPLERVTITSTGNVGIGTAVFGASAAKVLAIGNITSGSGAAPTTSTDLIHIYGEDISAGNCAFACFQEAAVAAAVAVASTHKWPVRINGTTYYVLMTT